MSSVLYSEVYAIVSVNIAPTHTHTRPHTHSLVSSSPAQFSVYKPLLMLFALIDCLHAALKSTLTVIRGGDLPSALLEHIRANDSAVLEACEKVPIIRSVLKATYLRSVVHLCIQDYTEQ